MKTLIKFSTLFVSCFLLSNIFAENFNYRAENGNASFANQELCEKQEQRKCYPLDPREAAIKSLKQIEVDDTSKPIIEETEPELVEVEPIDDKCPDGFNPRGVVNKPDEVANRGIEVANEVVKGCERKACEAPFELDNDKCRRVVGYEKKLEKRFVIDPAKVQAEEQRKNAEAQRVNACREFTNAVAEMVLTEQANAAAVRTAMINLLGKEKNCR